MRKTGKYSCGIAALAVAVICLLTVGCSEENGPFFADGYPIVRCHIDSINEYTLEGIIGKRLDASCSIANQYNRVAEVQVEPSTGLHRLVPKELGFTRIEITRNEEKTDITVQIVTDAIDSWEVKEREDMIVCTPGLKDEIAADMFTNQLLPELSQYDMLSISYGRYGQWRASFLVNAPSHLSFCVDYDKEQEIYYFQDYKNGDKKQGLTFNLISKEVIENRTYKEATFSYDLTDVYQKKYGTEHVQRVKVTYSVFNVIYF